MIMTHLFYLQKLRTPVRWFCGAGEEEEKFANCTGDVERGGGVEKESAGTSRGAHANVLLDNIMAAYGYGRNSVGG